MLSAVKVKALIRAGAAGRTNDGEGLQLFINKGGNAYWVLRCRVNGKDFERSLGPAAALTLAEARDKARELRASLTAAPDAPRAIPTFAEAARQHHSVVAPTLSNRKHAAQWIKTLEEYAFPTFGEKLISEVDEGDITAALLPIYGAKTETARRVLQRIRAVLSAAKGRGWRKHAIDYDAIRAALPKVKASVRHMPSLDFEDVPAFLSDLAASPAVPTVRAALAFLVHTAVRPGNIATARWAHIDLEAKVWTIPAELMKSGKVHRVPLTPQALAALKVAEKHRTSLSDLIFVGRDGVSQISPDTLRMAMRRLGTTATPHGFRSSFKNWSLVKGYPDHLSELALAHTDPNAVRAAYARSDLLELRAEMMAAWSDFLSN